MTTIELLLARNGGKLFTAGASTNLKANNYVYAVINEDAVISAMLDADTNDIHSDWGLGTNTLKTGMIISPFIQGIIDTITITSGTVFLIKG